MGLLDFLKPKKQSFDIDRYSLADSNERIMQDLMADPEGSNLFFRTYELLGYDPSNITIRNDPVVYQRVGQIFCEIVGAAIIAKLSFPGLNIVAKGDLDFKITLESHADPEITELYRRYVKHLFKIS